ncbi:hypothetical protein JMJ77_0014726, partial [Colletotrichum scovillei]
MTPTPGTHHTPNQKSVSNQTTPMHKSKQTPPCSQLCEGYAVETIKLTGFFASLRSRT